MPMAEARNLTVIRSHATLLDDVSAGVGAGEIVGVVGPNGAGKTSLLRALAGDITPTSGSVRVAGRDPVATPLAELSRIRAYLEPYQPSDVVFTVGEVVAMGRRPLRHTALDSQEHDAVVAASMADVDVGHLAERALSTLSTGERQRVGLARILAQQASVMLLDEPTSALDVGHQEMVMGTLRRVARMGVAVVIAIHDLNLAAAHADRIAVLSEGRLSADGEPWDTLRADLLSEVYAQPMRVERHPTRSCPLVVVVD